MQVCGVICEYNPFHSGHAYHLERARALSGADYVVCVMSGSVTQRGAFARHDKWTRARMALCGGADLVIELPVRFSAAPAQEFACGGVALLASLGVVTHLSFGCEESSLPALEPAAALLKNETDAFRHALHAHLSKGQPYPRALSLAAQEASGIDGLDAMLARPNAALAVEYLRALPPSVTPVPVARRGCGYHDASLGDLSSATAIRAALSRGDLADALSAVPNAQLLADAEARLAVHEEEALTQALLYRLRTMDAAELAAVAGVDEGLEHRILAAAKTAASRDALILAAKSKRYTYARLSRICTHALLGVTQAFADAHAQPTYARVLGFRREAQPLLTAIKKSAGVPLVTKAADYDRSDPLFALDVRAQDLWALGCRAVQRSGMDFLCGPVIV